MAGWKFELLKTELFPDNRTWGVFQPDREDAGPADRVTVGAFGVAVVRMFKDAYGAGEQERVKQYPLDGQFDPLNPWGAYFIAGQRHRFIGVGRGDEAQDVLDLFQPAEEQDADQPV